LQAKQPAQVASFTRRRSARARATSFREEARDLGGRRARLGHRLRDVLRGLVRPREIDSRGRALHGAELRVGLGVEEVPSQPTPNRRASLCASGWGRIAVARTTRSARISAGRAERVSTPETNDLPLVLVHTGDPPAEVETSSSSTARRTNSSYPCRRRGHPCRRRPPCRRAPCACRGARAWPCTCSRSSSSKRSPSPGPGSDALQEDDRLGILPSEGAGSPPRGAGGGRQPLELQPVDHVRDRPVPVLRVAGQVPFWGPIE